MTIDFSFQIIIFLVPTEPFRRFREDRHKLITHIDSFRIDTFHSMLSRHLHTYIPIIHKKSSFRLKIHIAYLNQTNLILSKHTRSIKHSFYITTIITYSSSLNFIFQLLFTEVSRTHNMHTRVSLGTHLIFTFCISKLQTRTHIEQSAATTASKYGNLSRSILIPLPPFFIIFNTRNPQIRPYIIHF